MSTYGISTNDRAETCQISGRVEYLIGVNRRFVDRDPELVRIYDELSGQRAARTVRNLSILRTALERSFRKICDSIRSGNTREQAYRCLPEDALSELEAEGIRIHLVKWPGCVLIEVNRAISERIDDCESLFPEWVNWDYLRQLFIMPGGIDYEGIKEEANKYYGGRKMYPFGIYINWPIECCGNVMANDRKFLTHLYSWHGDSFATGA